MITIATADKVLKTKYGPMLTNQLNDNTSPFYQKIEKTSKYLIGGKAFVMATPIGINGGIGSMDETDDVPEAGYQNYENFTTTAKQLAGTFRLTYKAWKSARTSEDAFINLFTSESKSLERGTKWDLNRQAWGTGSGKMGILTANGSASNTLVVASGIQNFTEGQIVDVYDYPAGNTVLVKTASKVRITAVNNKPGATYSIVVSGSAIALVNGSGGRVPFVTMQGSIDKEITGIEALYDATVTSLYGVNKSGNPWLTPYSKSADNNIADTVMQDMIQYLSDYFGSDIDMVLAGAGAYTAYYAYLEATKRNFNTQKLAGGFESLAYGTIPIVRDRFAANGNMDFIETNKWHFHQMGDWEWMEGYAGEGSILQQVANKTYYQAILIKLCNLMCDHPGGQGRLTNCNIA